MKKPSTPISQFEYKISQPYRAKIKSIHNQPPHPTTTKHPIVISDLINSHATTSIAIPQTTTRLRNPIPSTLKNPQLWFFDALEILEERQRDTDGIRNHFVSQCLLYN